MLYLAVCMYGSMLLEVLVVKKSQVPFGNNMEFKDLIGNYFAPSSFLSLSSAAAVSAV